MLPLLFSAKVQCAAIATSWDAICHCLPFSFLYLLLGKVGASGDLADHGKNIM